MTDHTILAAKRMDIQHAKLRLLKALLELEDDDFEQDELRAVTFLMKDRYVRAYFNNLRAMRDKEPRPAHALLVT